MIIQRNHYLNRLIAAKSNGLIKIITGIRRCGKSFLLFELFRQHLISDGADESHIIELAFDDRFNIEYRDPDNLLRYIKNRIVDDKRYYILLDEIQLVNDFVEVLNSLLHIRNADTYVTGSNSRFLSKDIATEFRGRGQEIHIYPLSFSEFYGAINGDINNAWKEYYTFGGLPQTLLLKDYQEKNNYLHHLANTVYINDVVERHKVKNRLELEELLRIIASSIGSSCNPTKLSNTFKSLKNITITNKTITNYLNHLCDAFMIERAIRYNIKGKKYINTLSKYYFTDVGLRNALLDFRQTEQTHLMENIIFNELLYRGFNVDVGYVEIACHDKNGKFIRKKLEVDFVANNADTRYYIQSAFSIPDESKLIQETASFRNIDDSFRKIIVVKDNIMPYTDNLGFLHIGLFDFLLKGVSVNSL